MSIFPEANVDNSEILQEDTFLKTIATPWVSLETADALSQAEIKRLIGRAYELVFARLPRKTQTKLG